MSFKAVLEVKYGTIKKRTTAMGIVYGESRMLAMPAILSWELVDFCGS